LHLAEDKKKGGDTPSTNSVPASPGPIVNPLDDIARETFPTGRPLEDPPDNVRCVHCKRVLPKTGMPKHIPGCLKNKREKVQRKKEQKEAREREKREERKEAEKDGEGDTKMDDDDDNDDEVSPEKKGPGGLKSAKKSAGKKVEVEKGKKRKAEGDAEKGPKQKKKKEEPKPKAPKQRGTVYSNYLSLSSVSFLPYFLVSCQTLAQSILLQKAAWWVSRGETILLHYIS
jgi:SAGA-associated factor 73